MVSSIMAGIGLQAATRPFQRLNVENNEGTLRKATNWAMLGFNEFDFRKTDTKSQPSGGFRV